MFIFGLCFILYINNDVLNDDVIDIRERENIDQNLLDEITVRFLHYFDVYESMSLGNRNFNTQVIYNIRETELEAIILLSRILSRAI